MELGLIHRATPHSTTTRLLWGSLEVGAISQGSVVSARFLARAKNNSFKWPLSTLFHITEAAGASLALSPAPQPGAIQTDREMFTLTKNSLDLWSVCLILFTTSFLPNASEYLRGRDKVKETGKGEGEGREGGAEEKEEEEGNNTDIITPGVPHLLVLESTADN